MKNRILLPIALLCMAQLLCAQAKNKYGYPLSIVSDFDSYLSQIEADSNKTLIEIKSRIPNIVLDIRYATENNFLKKIFYKQAKAFARLPVVKALHKVQAELNAKGIGVKIYDGYRPYAITVQFYESFPDSTYVRSRFSRGDRRLDDRSHHLRPTGGSPAVPRIAHAEAQQSARVEISPVSAIRVS